MGNVGDDQRLDAERLDTERADAERRQALADVATVLRRWEQHRTALRSAAQLQSPTPSPPPWALCVTRLGFFFAVAYPLPWLLTGGRFTAGGAEGVLGAAAIIWRTYRTSRRRPWAASGRQAGSGPSRGRWRP